MRYHASTHQIVWIDNFLLNWSRSFLGQSSWCYSLLVLLLVWDLSLKVNLLDLVVLQLIHDRYKTPINTCQVANSINSYQIEKNKTKAGIVPNPNIGTGGLWFYFLFFFEYWHWWFPFLIWFLVFSCTTNWRRGH